MKEAIRLIEKAKGLDIKDKLKLILFLTQTKPNTYIKHKTNEHNLGERYKILKLLKIYHQSKEKTYEEVTEIKEDRIIWSIKGTWTGLDIFKDKKSEQEFKRYVDLLTKGKHKEADETAGKLYGYPKTSITKHIKERNTKYLKELGAKKYYQEQQTLDRKFPYLFHKPKNDQTNKNLNEKYKNAIKKYANNLYKEYEKKRTYKTQLIVDGESDILKNGKSIWKKKQGHEYMLITKNKIENKHLTTSHYSEKKYKKGDILEGKITLQHDYAIIKAKKIGHKKYRHERKLPLLGRKY